MRFEQRLMRLEKNALSDFDHIVSLIAQGAHYDELSPEEQEEYKRYRESWGGVADDVAGAELEIIFCDKPKKEAYHFPLTERRRPPTKEEHALRIKEIEEIMLTND